MRSGDTHRFIPGRAKVPDSVRRSTTVPIWDVRCGICVAEPALATGPGRTGAA